ncbi:inhibitor of growth protein 3-like [Actinia tenebrosa]|uniref:Inhibitor of growth protein 3-like n=1 Tax=Actinia tenebrosa TaxID=6105 RepID=A0A6P8H7Z0_ACTTE|nr:inhibitor of growth protein 3-like [Actinia tenebrosa]
MDQTESIDIEDLSQKVLLPVQEVKWHLDHYGNIREKRKAKTAAKKSSQMNDCLDNNIGMSCIVCKGMASVCCSADPEQCTDAYCLGCLDLKYPPPMEWVCPMCQEDADVYCVCSQGEYGLMVGCDGPKCVAQWFHLQCVGLTEEPKTEQWFCPLCSQV